MPFNQETNYLCGTGEVLQTEHIAGELVKDFPTHALFQRIAESLGLISPKTCGALPALPCLP